MAHFSETAAIMNRFFFISLGVVLLVGMSFIYMTRKHLLKPLTVIKESAEKITALDYVTITDYPPNELGDLAHSLNVMSQSLKQNQERLNQQNQQIRQLTADLTHELKTPIAVIQVYASGIADGIDDGSYHQVILKQAEELDRIVSDMLQFSRISQVDFPLSSVDFLAVLRKQLERVAFLLTAKEKKVNVSANFDWQQDKVLILGNDYLLGLIIDNLLSNGIRYSAGQEIEIKLEKNTSQLVFEISNQLAAGEAIVTEVKTLWQPFVVGQESRNKELVGTGLGLAIVEHALRQHQTTGAIVVEEQRFSVKILFALADG